jgi:hypothetical protein
MGKLRITKCDIASNDIVKGIKNQDVFMESSAGNNVQDPFEFIDINFTHNYIILKTIIIRMSTF